MAAPLETTKVASGDPLAEKIARIIDDEVKQPADAYCTPAEETANTIDSLFRQQRTRKSGDGSSNDGQSAEDFLYTLWDVMLKAVFTIPATDPRLARLVSVVAALKKTTTCEVEIWDSKTTVWTDLPMLGAALREAWNTKPEDGEQDHVVLQKWISLNSFAARILGHRLLGSANLALWELRAALEDRHASEASRDWHLSIASEWLFHAGEELFRLSRTAADEQDAKEVKMTSAGPLAPEGLRGGASVQRWTFWKKRLVELSRELSHETKEEGLKERVEGVICKMDSIQGGEK